MEKKVLRFAVVGCGRIGHRHIEHIRKIGQLVAVIDASEMQTALFQKDSQVSIFNSLESFLQATVKCDVVSICTPNYLHAEQSIACLNAGYHVVCEKPMALTEEDCKAMLTAANAGNRQLFVIKQNRYNEPVQKIKQMIDDGSFGKLLSLHVSCIWNRNDDYYKNSWKGSLLMDGGTLFTQFSHFIDLMIWMAGDVQHVHSYKANQNHSGEIEFEDTGVAIFSFAGGALGSMHYTVNACVKNMEGSITLIGEKATAKIGGEYLNELEYLVTKEAGAPFVQLGNKPKNFGTYTSAMSNHMKAYQNIVDVLQNNASTAASVSDAIKTVALINKMYQSVTS